MIFAIPAITLFSRVSGLYAEQITNYFLCEEQGVDPNNPGLCDVFRDAFRRYSYPELTTPSFILINLFPIMFLIYTVNFEELKEKVAKFRDKKKKIDQCEMQVTTATSQ